MGRGARILAGSLLGCTLGTARGLSDRAGTLRRVTVISEREARDVIKSNGSDTYPRGNSLCFRG